MRSRILFFVVLAATIVFSQPGSAAVQGFKVTTDKTIDHSSLETIVQQVIERAGARSNDEKAIALYEYLHATIFHRACPTEEKPQTVGPLKSLNVYGWGLCGSQHTVMKALYETAGFKCRYVGWSDPGHSTIEVFYDDRWHYLDVFLKCYFWTKDKAHLASQDEIAADPSIVLDAVKEGRAARQHLCCGDSEKGVLSGIRSRKVQGDSKGWANVTWRDENYSPALRLPAGASLRLEWKGEGDLFAVSGYKPEHTCGTRDFHSDAALGPLLEHYGPRNWSNGRFTYAPDFSRASDLADVQLTNAKATGGKLIADGNGVAIFSLPLPYAYVTVEVQAHFANGAGQLSLSTDGGKTWKPCANGDLSTSVKQKYDVRFKAEFTGEFTKFELNAVVEHNRGAQPYLVQGKNRVTVSTVDNQLPLNTTLVVSYSFQEASSFGAQKRSRWTGKNLVYSEMKTITKQITQLPFTFDLEVGGNTAPKMLALERKVQERR